MKNLVLVILILFTQSCATNLMEALNKPRFCKNNLNDDY